MSETDVAEVAVLPIVVCSRVADGRAFVPNCAIRHCTGCFQAVWMSPASQEAAGGRRATALCITCFATVSKDDAKITALTPGQIKELRAYYKVRERPP